jgi:hypothetical protein
MEVARRLGYRDDEPIRKAIRVGRLPAFQVSPRRTLIAESDVEAWLQNCRVKGVTPAALATAPPPRASSPRTPRVIRKRELPVLGGAVVRA